MKIFQTFTLLQCMAYIIIHEALTGQILLHGTQILLHSTYKYCTGNVAAHD